MTGKSTVSALVCQRDVCEASMLAVVLIDRRLASTSLCRVVRWSGAAPHERNAWRCRQHWVHSDRQRLDDSWWSPATARRSLHLYLGPHSAKSRLRQQMSLWRTGSLTDMHTLFSFLSCDAMCKRGVLCPSVCPSVTFVYCVEPYLQFFHHHIATPL